MPMLWHTLSVESVLGKFSVDQKQGLSQKDAEQRLKEHGKNILEKGKGLSPWKILFEQFQNVLIIILLIAVGLSAILGQKLEAIAIVIIVLFAVFLGFIQEYKADRAMEALKKMAAPEAKVIRLGQEKTIPAEEIVPGDIILIATGDKIPADARLIESVNLSIAEAALTGESSPVSKKITVIDDEVCPL